jgi:hypothetical protein
MYPRYWSSAPPEKTKAYRPTKKLERFKSFSNFCWLAAGPPRNDMRGAIHSLCPPIEESRPTMAYSRR